MFSCLVAAFPEEQGALSPEGVVRTLAALVPGAVAGLIGDVTLVGPAGFADLGHIADHAGCEFYAGGEEELLQRGLMAGRRELSLVIRSGYVPGSGFLDELADLVGRRAGAFRAAVLRERKEGMAGLLTRGRVAAIVAHRRALLVLCPCNFDRMARRARPDRKLRGGALRVG